MYEYVKSKDTHGGLKFLEVLAFLCDALIVYLCGVCIALIVDGLSHDGNVEDIIYWAVIAFVALFAGVFFTVLIVRRAKTTSMATVILGADTLVVERCYEGRIFVRRATINGLEMQCVGEYLYQNTLDNGLVVRVTIDKSNAERDLVELGDGSQMRTIVSNNIINDPTIRNILTPIYNNQVNSEPVESAPEMPAASTEGKSLYTCSNCGTLIKEYSKFCPNCAAPSSDFTMNI